MPGRATHLDRRAVHVDGMVQGVGFRPFVHGLAERLGLAGWVRNDPDGVFVEIEGDPARLDSFLAALRDRPPPLAEIRSVEARRLPPRGARGFRILPSRRGRTGRAPLPPDAATCEECLSELRDPADRRHGYPFLNCTRCGPRFTIVRGVPYDRPRTTMAGFRMCGRCRSEYEDPADRRFHAQPTACPECGPRLAVLGADGSPPAPAPNVRDPLTQAADALLAGRIVAVKGLGGFHLACDATSASAVERLRRRKARDRKPFAVMARDVAAARRLCAVDGAEEALLTSVAAPVVLLRRRSASEVASAVAPGNRYLGVMLPYTPLHHLLLERVGRPLVLTSGNRSGEPIAYRDENVVERLGRCADLFLVHDRPIHVRCDDSVLQVACGGPVPIRRSRGYVPRPLPLPADASPEPLLALGGHLKNTFCLAAAGRAHLSAHVGDLDDPEARVALREQISHLSGLTGLEPVTVVHDLHPDYATTRLAEELEGGGLRRIAVQHHHAHVAACAAEHGHEGPVIGVAFDGSGYGPDGSVWGGEFLLVEGARFRRLGHLAPVRLPGGEAAVREPWRMAVSHLHRALEGAEPPGGWDALAPDGTGEERIRGVLELVRAGTASPPTSSVGRLFDAVAALAGVRWRVEFEAEAAMALEAAADLDAPGTYPVAIRDGGAGPDRPGDEQDPRTGDGVQDAHGGAEARAGGTRPWWWDPAPLVRGALVDLGRGETAGAVAMRFHRSVRDAVVAGCVRAREETRVEAVALTGGVFLNRLLTEATVPALREEGFRVLLHRLVPAGDGGLCYGQAAVACRMGGNRPTNGGG